LFFGQTVNLDNAMPIGGVGELQFQHFGIYFGLLQARDRVFSFLARFFFTTKSGTAMATRMGDWG
jgi:hypothetical protein